MTKLLIAGANGRVGSKALKRMLADGRFVQARAES
jgi:dihydrodipicolinate reductase